ncbi:hypothetical protein GLOIN_2v1535567 [Rhizophagus irregularis DAOM 181602=DAOM 197198]|nr:hypothetical protein GLOIN_2v1535567 [Rhizophagus irregularis DAOM 181602=DAOM 197198]
MSKGHFTPGKLVAIGNLVPELHYGPFSRDWWYYSDSQIQDSNTYAIPIRLGFQVALKLNQKHFIIRIVRNLENPNTPGFICEGEGINSGVCFSSSAAINTIYGRVFGNKNKTKYPGATMLGFHDSYMIQQMLNDVDFRPFTICLYNITIFIASIPDNNNYEGFAASFTYKYKQKQSVIWQKIEGGLFSISIFQNGEMVKQFQDITASSVWNQTQLLRNCDGIDLFGINHPLNYAIHVQIISKKHVPGDDELWYRILNRWYNQKSTIIEIKSFIRDFYNDNHEINMRELRAWRVMLEAIGCKNITPFERDVSDMEFWSRAKDPKGDIETISNLFSNGFLNTTLNSTIRNDEFENCKDTANVFWYSLCESLDANPNGSSGKIRILSIVAENFTYEELMKNLQVSPKTVHAAREYHHKNGPGCKALDKPIIVRKRMAEVKEREFELFFADKANVNMSSYHIDKKTQLPVLYLKDQKSALWERFSAIYPDGMKRTSFMARLQNGRFKYRDDLGGLCLICNDYAYQPFEDLIKLVSNNITNTKTKNELITQLEMLRRHLKKNYENELLVHDNGTTKHVDCINHCLLHAFGECVEQHFSRCAACDKLFEVFATLSHLLGHSYNTLLSEYQEKLTCYLAHQTRKKYLSAQFNAVLDELDDHGAIIVVDYKMRQDIERAIEELSGTSVAQIEPNRNKNNENMVLEKSCNTNYKKTKTIPGISKWFVWDWPITEEAAGYVRAKSLPNIGKWTEFSPADINTFCGEINRPNPEYTTPTKPKTPWLTSLSMKKGMQKSLERDEMQNSPTPISNQMGVDTEFPLKPGWALKENQKMGNKGGGKRISKKVIQYLQAYFHAGNLNPKDRYTAEKMHESLKELAHENELSVEDIPEVKTIRDG